MKNQWSDSDNPMNIYYYCVSCWDMGEGVQRKVWTKFETWKPHSGFLLSLNEWNREGSKGRSGLIYTYYEISQAEYELKI